VVPREWWAFLRIILYTDMLTSLDRLRERDLRWDWCDEEWEPWAWSCWWFLNCSGLDLERIDCVGVVRMVHGRRIQYRRDAYTRDGMRWGKSRVFMRVARGNFGLSISLQERHHEHRSE